MFVPTLDPTKTCQTGLGQRGTLETAHPAERRGEVPLHVLQLLEYPSRTPHLHGNLNVPGGLMLTCTDMVLS